jgi:hypothetical protein
VLDDNHLDVIILRRHFMITLQYFPLFPNQQTHTIALALASSLMPAFAEVARLFPPSSLFLRVTPLFPFPFYHHNTSDASFDL